MTPTEDSETTFPQYTSLSAILEEIPLDHIHHLKIQNSDIPVLCPDCNSEIKVKNCKKRYIKESSGQKIPFSIKRYYCPVCEKLHTEIPIDLFLPYKQYDNDTIKKAKQGFISTLGVGNSTLYYWQQESPRK